MRHIDNLRSREGGSYSCDIFFASIPKNSKLTGEKELVEFGRDSIVLHQPENGNLLKIYTPLQNRIADLEYERFERRSPETVSAIAKETLALYFEIVRALRQKISELQAEDPFSEIVGANEEFSLEIASPGTLIQRGDIFASVVRHPIAGKNFLKIKKEQEQGKQIQESELRALQTFSNHCPAMSKFLREQILAMNFGEHISRTPFCIGEMNAKPILDSRGKLTIVITDVANAICQIVPV